MGGPSAAREGGRGETRKGQARERGDRLCTKVTLSELISSMHPLYVHNYIISAIYYINIITL